MSGIAVLFIYKLANKGPYYRGSGVLNIELGLCESVLVREVSSFRDVFNTVLPFKSVCRGVFNSESPH